MEYDRKLLQDAKRLMIARFPRFGAEIATANLEYKTDLKYHTAATDGKNIYFDPDYLASLSDDDKLFIIAHELMHIKFEHMYRIMGKDSQRRDINVWNIATDAIINANLERDGFKIKKGYVNMPEALNYNAEELYEHLIKEKQAEQQQQSGNNGGHGQGQNGKENELGQDQGANSDEQFADDHSFWEKAFEEGREQTNEQNADKNNGTKFNEQQAKNSILDPSVQIPKFDEKAEFQNNRIERRERARRNIEKIRNQELKKSESGYIEFGDVGQAKPILDWRLLLRREVEKTETVWSQRRSIAENNYAYRLEENDVEDQAETEVMIDVSGSVSLAMVKAFLRQLKPLLKESKLKVGFFASYATKKFQEIKNDRDVDKIKIPNVGGGTNMDGAVRAFSKKREINKIVFTDGYPGELPKQDTKEINVIWLVYSNRNFHPCCGKVIDVYPNDVQKMINITETELSR